MILALLPALAHAGDVVFIGGCDHDHDHDHEVEEADDEPVAVISSARESHLRLQYGMQFLPDVPGHHLQARLIGAHDAYLSGELRYHPGSDVVGVGRVGAGLDVFGKSDWDLTLGLFVGSAGEWDRQIDRAVLYAAPIAGTEIGVGIDGDRIFAGYRWLAGIGGGPVDELLTENELTFGYKITSTVHAFGQYLVLMPGELEDEAGVGLGVRVVL